MFKRRLFIGIVTALLLLVIGSSLTAAQGPGGTPLAPLGTTFTYQGQLQDGSGPVSNTCDFEFRLYDAASGGTQIGTTQTKTNVSVANGLFTVPDLDFGAGAFEGSTRWLEIAVRCPAGSGAYNTLAPRQALTAAPYANYAQASPWGGLAGVPVGFADNTDNDVLGGIVCADGQVAKWNGASWACADDETAVVVTGTNIYAGEGLSAFSSGSSITLSVAVPYRLPQGCADGELPLWDGSTWNCGDMGAHDHWGQTWTGSGTGLVLQGGTGGLEGHGTLWGVYGESASTAGTGVRGHAAATSGTTYGVYGTVVSTAGAALYGEASAATGNTRGVVGRVASGAGTGVYGEATATSGPTYGVRGSAASPDGFGLYGTAPLVGVYGEATSPYYTTQGVYGVAAGSSSDGVYGLASGPEGRGVEGVATDTTSGNYGVYGVAYSTIGTGVSGAAMAATGENSGVKGISYSADGYGVWGVSSPTGIGVGIGVLGESYSVGGDGVVGYAHATTGQSRGVVGHTNSTTDGMGVLGWSHATTGPNFGVLGSNSSPQGVGVAGENWATTGGHGVTALSQGGGTVGAALHAEAANTTNGVAIVGFNSSGDSTMVLENLGAGDLIKAFISAGQLRFRVTNAGDVLSDAGFHTPAADMAEMLPAAAGLEPGDVLCIGLDGQLARCQEAYQGSVVGVYSTRPGFVGGSSLFGDAGDKVPLAVVGVVPVKATAENGAIVPGDLLVASGTAGHTMRCVGVDKCFGRTIGKALEGLDQGTGTILMLVVLQ